MSYDAEGDMTRTQRHSEHRAVLVRRARVVGAVALGVLVVAGAAFAALRVRTSAVAHATPPLASASSPVPGVQPVVASASRVEVPNLVGMPLTQAKAIVGAAGLGGSVRIIASLPADPSQAVRVQLPSAGTVVALGSKITLTCGPKAKKGGTARRGGSQFVVVLDPGHQSHADTGLEPFAPGSKRLVPAMDAGSTGVSTGLPEYELALQLATNVKARLEAQGVRVILTRTTDDVQLSYAARAQVASRAKAGLLVALHADSALDAAAAGVSVAYPAVRASNSALAVPSKQAAIVLESTVVSATGASDDGTIARADFSEFAWSKVPSVLVEAGNPANPVEDRLLSSARYQDLLAQGLADGIVRFLKGGSQ